MNHHELLPIVKRLEAHQITYALGGSGMLRYLNLTDTVNDWDLAVECPKDKLIQAIRDYDWIEQSVGGYPFASLYRISIPSLNIDFIGYFAMQTEGGILNLSIRRFEDWDGIRISNPEAWYVAYSLMNRTSKANILLDYLRNNRAKVNGEAIADLLQTKGLQKEIVEELKLLLVNSDKDQRGIR